MKQFKIYGITGGAGTGKSEVMRMLKDYFGAYVILTDEVARDLTKKGHVSYQLIVDHFGQDILQEDGEIDRPRLASIVFQDAEELQALNGMTRPYVRQEVERLTDQARRSGKYPFAAVESAILLEAGFGDMMDEIWYIYTDPQIRRQRMKQTRGYSDARVDAVMSRQADDSVMRRKADFVLTNNSSLEDVRRQLEDKLY